MARADSGSTPQTIICAEDGLGVTSVRHWSAPMGSVPIGLMTGLRKYN